MIHVSRTTITTDRINWLFQANCLKLSYSLQRPVGTLLCINDLPWRLKSEHFFQFMFTLFRNFYTEIQSLYAFTQLISVSELINKIIFCKKRCVEFQNVRYLHSRVSSWRYEVQAAVHSGVRNPFFTGDVNFLLQKLFILLIDIFRYRLPTVNTSGEL